MTKKPLKKMKSIRNGLQSSVLMTLHSSVFQHCTHHISPGLCDHIRLSRHLGLNLAELQVWSGPWVHAMPQMMRTGMHEHKGIPTGNLHARMYTRAHGHTHPCTKARTNWKHSSGAHACSAMHTTQTSLYMVHPVHEHGDCMRCHTHRQLLGLDG